MNAGHAVLAAIGVAVQEDARRAAADHVIGGLPLFHPLFRVVAQEAHR